MAMRGHLDFSKPADVMWWAAALTAFFGCFRKDNVTVDKESSFNSSANNTCPEVILHLTQGAGRMFSRDLCGFVFGVLRPTSQGLKSILFPKK